MRTILQAFKDEVAFPVSEGFLVNRLIARGLCPDDDCRAETLRSRPFKGALADTLVGIIRMPNTQEGDMSIELTNRGLLMEQANGIYRDLGEPEVGDDSKKPIVRIGW
ncbi:MAG: hypothetical protein Q4A64_03365 [Porphyromonadaceae bacterium]|nr:hypothetical protein [Porphyromonadaceae bacterium]